MFLLKLPMTGLTFVNLFPLSTSNFVTFALQGQKCSFVSLQIFETRKGLIRTSEVILEMHLKHMNGDMFEHLTVYLILYTIQAGPLKQVVSAACICFINPFAVLWFWIVTQLYFILLN